MPFRASFDCLWCGRSHTVRESVDLEGFAQLCPECVGRAQENEFLRHRVKAALHERASRVPVSVGGSTPDRPASRATGAPAAPAPRTTDTPSATSASLAVQAHQDAGLGQEMVAYYEARAAEYDDWYLRRGRYSHGPLSDLAWQYELDTATTWLDALPFHGEIVELAAGTGWWSPLLAEKGELSIYDAAEAPLDRARERLLAHRLKAHIHVRDAWAEPDRAVDGLFTGFWLSHVPRERLPSFLRLAHRWLRPRGIFAFIDSLRDADSGAVDGTAVGSAPGADGGAVNGIGAAARGEASDVLVRRLADGREFRVPKIYYAADELERALKEAGFATATVTATPRFFLLGHATA